MTPGCKKTKRSLDIVAAVALVMKVDCYVTSMDLATAHGVSSGANHNILDDELKSTDGSPSF